MEIYALDALNRRQYVIDQFISLIWTERWQAYGDFELHIISTPQTRTVFKPDTWLGMNRSNYVMRVESVEDDLLADGSRDLIVKGRSIDAVLGDRPWVGSIGTDKPAILARALFHEVCVVGFFDAGDIIAGVYEGTFATPSNIPEPTDPITINITSPTTLFDAIVNQICTPWELGFRMLRQDTTGQIYFDIYSGSDRTSDQTILTPVIFAPQLDNLQNTKELVAIDKAKNVAYVFSPAGNQTVYATGVDPTTSSFERRALVVNASDVTSSTGLAAILSQRGMQALAAARTNFLFDGEVSQNSSYQYGTDYNLGDLVEQQNTDGVQTQMRVTEQIFVDDAQGERSYPTLVSNTVINTGSWLSWNNNKAWFDLNADTTNVWGNQP